MKTLKVSFPFRHVLGIIVIAFFSTVFNVRAQSTTESIAVLNRVKVNGSITLIHYSLGEQSLTVPLPSEILLGIALDSTGEPSDTTSAHSRRGPVSYEDDSRINGHDYSVSMEEDGFAQFANRTDGTVARIPVDIIQYADVVYGRYYRRPDTAISGVRLDSESQSIDLLIQRSLPVYMVIVLFLVLLFTCVVMMVLKARRERSKMLASRRRLILAREEERSKLSADLHDGPIQELQLILRSSDANKHEQEITNRLNRYAVLSVTHQLRDVCADLRPPVLQHFGFCSAARTCAAKFSLHYPAVQVHLSISDYDDTLSNEKRLTLFRVLQEALANVGKHADAKNVWLTIDATKREIFLTVKDDGRGFTLPRNLTEFEQMGHLGLSFLSQRVESIGAVLSISSTQGTGTRIRLVVPIDNERKRRKLLNIFARLS